jgi:hypothetical protein
VAQWYAIDGAVEHLIQGSCAVIVRLEQLGTAVDGADLAAGRLLVAFDCQACCDWLVDLTPTFPASSDVPLPGLATPAEHQAAVANGADPPVWLSEPGDPADTWSLATMRFSAYVYAKAWDIAFGGMLHDAYISAFDDVPFGDGDLALLQREFVAGPRSSGWAGHFGAPDLVVHRFEQPGQRVRVAAHPKQSEWQLAADSAQSLERLVELLSKGNHALAGKLHPAR